ncbi:MAG: hypothetical protein ACKPKO_44120 [Candidatus Fonsibacter sp.]
MAMVGAVAVTVVIGAAVAIGAVAAVAIGVKTFGSTAVGSNRVFRASLQHHLPLIARRYKKKAHPITTSSEEE